MKKPHLLLIIFLFISAVGYAQIDRTKLPEPGPAPEIELGEVKDFSLPNGLQVFVVENHKLPRVAFSLVLERDPLLEGEKAGMTGFVGEMLTAGTTNRTKEQLDEEVDFIGASLSAGSTSLYGSSLTKHQDKILELMADVLFNPVFPQAELDKLKKQALTSLAAAKDNPNAISSRLTNALVYGKEHPYGENQTEETTENITVEDIRNYYETYFKPNIAYMAIVGDINAKEAEKLVRDYFGKWESSNVPEMGYETPQAPDQIKVAIVDRPASVQSVIKLAYPLEMNPAKEDYLATRVLAYILGGGFNSRLNMKLREEKGFTYGAGSSIGSDKLIANFTASTSVRTEVTDSALTEMIHEIRKIVQEGITEEELEEAKANLSGSFGRSLENPSTIASFAINIAQYNLPEDYYSTYLQRLDDLTVEDIDAATKKYIQPDNMHITIVGNSSAFEDKLVQFGEIKKYTNTGEEAREMAMDADMTAEKVIDRYIEAIGGEEKAAAIKTANIKQSSEIQGQQMVISTFHDLSSMKFEQEVSMMGQVMQKITMENGKATISAQGQSQTLSDEQYEEAKMGMYIFPELHYKEMGYSFSLDGIQDVDGEKAYKLTVTNPTGSSVVNYYHVDTGLKIRSESPTAGNINYNKYDTVEGLKYPMEMNLQLPGMPMAIVSKVESVTFN
ncbi:MAG TPA: pitrilysin family protein [Cyclobacteriaceae bacterium]|nr:pitrilysin family protein [Cyclobacteriaceae bacterium]